MNILLTNDDGYKAEGLSLLHTYFCEQGHSVIVVAPDREKSGCSHAITLKEEIKLVKKQGNVHIIKGTPADCVYVGIMELAQGKVDAVVSGVNHGRNVGKDIYFSGTVAGARQGCFFSIPSIALSADVKEDPVPFSAVAAFLDEHFTSIVKKGEGKNIFFNVNFPGKEDGSPMGLKVTRPSPDYKYEDKMVSFESPFQGKYYWISGHTITYSEDETTDIWAIRNNYISLTPLEGVPGKYEGFSL